MTQEFIEMEEALQLLQAKDTKERMAGVERLQSILEQSRKALTATEVASLVDASLSLLKDNNFRVCQGALQALASAAALANEHLKLHFNVLLPAIVERLGDNKQPVRDAGRRVLLALMEISSPTIVVERAGNYAWTHKNWRVREEFARTVASAINLFAATEVPFQRLLLPSVLQLLEDSNSNAREAAMACLEEMYRQGASQLHEELQRHSLRPAQLKEITSRFEKISPKVHGFDGAVRFVFSEAKSSSNSSAGSNQRSSPKIKPAALDNNSSAGDSDAVEKPVDPVRVHSDKELTKELEKVAGVLTPEQDWSVRMAALRRIEGLIFGGAAEYACFPSLVKQLIRPLCLQLSDRRSSIVKQACHLLCLLSKELLADFESCAEAFIPVLFKLVVITVLVIAESADTCIKTMLRNCKVARVLPRIVDSAKNDRCSVLRVRCCEYALLVLEQWADSPEIQRAADLYEDLIKCCVGDAMSEVRSTARMCYRIFSRCWPERARQLYGNFDPVIQRVINEEEGGIHRRYVSPSLSERGSQQVKQSVNLPMHPASGGEQSLSFGASPIVAMDHSTSLLSGVSSATTGNLLMAQRKPAERASERSLESVLQASQQSVNAIETMLKGMDVSEKGNIPSAIRSVQKNAGESYKNIYASSYTVHGGIDPPSARDPPQPAVPVFNQSCSRTTTTSTNLKGSSGGAALLSKVGIPVVTPPLAGPEVGRCGKSANSIPLFSNPAKRIPVFSEKSNQNSSNDDESERKSLKRPQQVEKSGLDMVFKEFSHRDVSYHSVPGFQRPLLRTSSSARSSASSRGIIDDSQLLLGEGRSCMDGLMSLNDALAEGLSSTADWSARVAAFSYLRALLQQGSRGVQEVVQCFEKVMKLFCQHLDDPHHKVAQAALTTLSDLIPLCRKPFETYLERILPHVFLRLVDPKEIIRQLSTSILDMVGHSYTIDSLLPALLRSLDEQRSPKAKIAVIEFAIASFARLGMNGEIAGGNNLLRVWLAKLAPLANDKNAKVKETAVHGLISVYSHYDSTAVLNFIIGLAIQEQSTLRRALKQYTPRIESDLVNFFQSKGQRTRTKPQGDQHDSSGAVLENDYGTSSARRNASQKAPLVGSYSSGSLNSDSGIKPAVQTNVYERHKVYYKSLDDAGVMDDSPYFDKPSGHQNSINSSPDRTENCSDQSLSTTRLSLEAQHPFKSSVSPKEKVLTDIEQCIIDAVDGMDSRELQLNDEKHEKAIFPKRNKKIPLEGTCLDIPALLHQLCSGSDEKLQTKREALEEFMQLSCKNDTAMWSQYVNQILTSVLEVLDDSDATVRELALSTLSKMLSNQKEILEDSVEVLLEKLLHSVKDIVAKVSCAADQCLSTVLRQYDPYRCLTVVVPLLVSEDEKTLVTCISSLTKLISRLPPEELMSQLPSFLPSLFDAFGNQSADVRKTVVFCLVDIYIVLGKEFLPYLGSLSSSQLRLVTIYANRISQARSGTPLDPALS